MPRLAELGAPANFLDTNLSDIPQSVPVTFLERRFLRRFFKRESISRGPDQPWLGRTWELRLGAVNDLVYKVGFESVASSRDDAVELTAELSMLLQRTFGTEECLREAIWLWPASDGNVVMQLANVRGERRVMLFLTSNSIQNASRV
jgi:hypothetical protein